MLQDDTKAQITTRVKAINLTPKRLARLASVDPMTVYRGPKRLVSHQAVMDALVAEERRILDHLIRLHGIPQSHRKDAA